MIYLWQQLATFSGKSLILPALTPNTALHGLWNDHTNIDKPIINHVLPSMFGFTNISVTSVQFQGKHHLNILNLFKNIKEIKKG